MKLRGLDFGSIFVPIDIFNICGNDWNWFDEICKLLFLGELDYSKVSFVSETVTLNPVGDNIAVDYYNQLFRILSPYKRLQIIRGTMLTSFKSNNPGIKALLAHGFWQETTKPKFISFTFSKQAITLEKKIKEARVFVEIMRPEISEFHGPIGIELYVPCSYKGRFRMSDTFRDAFGMLEVLAELNLPIALKFNAVDMITGRNVSELINESEVKKLFDLLVLSFEIPYGSLMVRISRMKKSQLINVKDNKLSGRNVQEEIYQWLIRTRGAGITIPIMVGGTALSLDDVKDFREKGANAIMINPNNTIRYSSIAEIIGYTKTVKECQ